MRRSIRTAFQFLSAIAVFMALSGCETVMNRVNSEYGTTIGKKRKTTNVYQKGELPPYVKRVAVLPMYKGDYEHIDMAAIEENFRLELVKRGLFEVVIVAPDTMKELFSKERLSSVEYLPTQLLAALHSKYAIDGALLFDVSYFSPYQPVGLGIRVKLVDGHTGEIIWAADEVFDSSNPAVSNAARKYYKTESIMQYPLQGAQGVLHSPNRFSKYVANSLYNAIYLKND